MIPIDFEEANVELQKPSDMTDEECSPLPVYTDGKYCTSCWQVSFIEKIKILLFGKVWLQVRSGETQPPVRLIVENNIQIKGD